MSIKENSLAEETNFNLGQYIRLVSNKFTGTSKLVLASSIRWAIENISGLQTILDSKAAKETVTGLKSMLSYVKADGSFSGSGFKMVTCPTNYDYQSQHDMGLYSFPDGSNVSTAYGAIHDILILDNSTIGESVSETAIQKSKRLIFCDNGIFYGTYDSSSGGWSQSRYIGGGVMNISGTRALLMNKASEGTLTPGALYVLTDHTHDNGIILEASTENTFNPNAVRLGLAPSHYKEGIYPTGTAGANETWIGTWMSTKSVSIGNLAVFCGNVWRNTTGYIGATDGEYELNAGDWDLVPVESGPYYEDMLFSCVYDIEHNYITLQKDNINNVELGRGFYDSVNTDDVDRCDWSSWSDFAVPQIKNCKQVLIYGNDSFYNTIRINNIKGIGTIKYNDFATSGNIIIDSTINSIISGCLKPSITESEIKANIAGTNFAGFDIFNSVIRTAIGAITLTASLSIRESKGKILGCVSLAGASFTVQNGTGWYSSVGTFTQQYIKKNGVDVVDRTFVAKYAGDYEITHVSSASSAVKSALETSVFINSTLQVHLTNKKTYNTTGDFINSVISGILTLAVGDVVSIKYRQDAIATVTYTSYSFTTTLKYEN